MASNSTKSFLADAGYGEQELDANSALMELDKGIQKSVLSGCDGRGGEWRHQAVIASGMRVASLGGGRAPVLSVNLEVCREIAALLDWSCTNRASSELW